MIDEILIFAGGALLGAWYRGWIAADTGAIDRRTGFAGIGVLAAGIVLAFVT